MASPSNRFRLTGPRERTVRPFEIVPDHAAREALAGEMGLSALKKLRFAGELRPLGSRDWELDATLGATFVQPCGVTLEPVTTRIDEVVRRRYLADLAAEEPAAEQAMPAETEEEPLPGVLDLDAVMAEALSLAVPPFPRAPGVEAGATHSAGPGVETLSADDRAALSRLRANLGEEGT